MRSAPAPARNRIFKAIHKSANSAILALLLLLASAKFAQTQTLPEQPTSTFRSTTTLVFLDVTVLDKKGRIVTSGLTQDDFTITEDKRPQRIFSFEPPETHIPDKLAKPAGDTPDGSAPATILILDQLNSSFEDFAFLSDKTQKYLEDQPATLAAPAELMLLGNRSLELVQGYTRSRADLLFALKHVPTDEPYKRNPAFTDERFFQSIQALQQIALQNQTVSGRKNIIWIGPGGPSTILAYRNIYAVPKIERFVHQTTNMLVDARITLFVIFPGLKVKEISAPHGDKIADARTDPFGGDINFTDFVSETGGKLFYNQNDVDELIRESQRMGTEYYTLTYRPEESGSGVKADGEFRNIRVTLRNPDLRVVTKGGYYAPDEAHPIDPEKQTILNISQAVQSSIPYTGLAMKVDSIVRHPDSRTADITVTVESKNIHWQSTDDGKSTANLILLAVSFSSTRQILANKLQGIAFSAKTQDPEALAHLSLKNVITLRVPNNTQSIRIAAQTEDGASIGTADLTRQTINQAQSAPTPEPATKTRP